MGEARRHDPTAVEAGGRAERALRGDEERDPTTEAEPDDADLPVREAHATEIAERGVDVDHDRVVAPDPDEVLDHRAEIAVVDDGPAGAVEHVGRDRVISSGGDPPGDVFDVRIDAERLLDDDDGTGRFAVGNGLVAAHRAVGGVDLLVSGSHVRSLGAGPALAPAADLFGATVRTLIVRRMVMGFKVVVDFDKCESNALCMGVAPEVFEVREDDFLYVLQEEPPDELRDKCNEAARVCPKQAITIEDL